VICQSKLCVRMHKVTLTVGLDGSGLSVNVDGIDENHKVPAEEIGREVQARRTQVHNLDVWSTVVFAAKHLDGQTSKAVVAEKNVAQANHADAPLRHTRTLTHNTFT